MRGNGKEAAGHDKGRWGALGYLNWATRRAWLPAGHWAARRVWGAGV
jgi:hypothetical protein